MKRFELVLVEPNLLNSCVFQVNGNCIEPEELQQSKCRVGCDISQNGKVWVIEEIKHYVMPIEEIKEAYKREKKSHFKRQYRGLLKAVANEYKKKGMSNREIAEEFQSRGIKMLSGKGEWNLCSVFRLTNANIIGAVEADDAVSNKS